MSTLQKCVKAVCDELYRVSTALPHPQIQLLRQLLTTPLLCLIQFHVASAIRPDRLHEILDVGFVFVTQDISQ